MVPPAGHVQSLLLAAVLLLTGVVSVIAGILADLISINRSLLEEVVSRQRRLEADRAGAAGTEAPGPPGPPGSPGPT